jgi:hypothetical protein
MSNHIVELTRVTAEVALRKPVIEQRGEKALQSAVAALRSWQPSVAKEWFELSIAWNQLHKFVHDCNDVLANARLTYVVDSWFLHDLIAHLTPNQDEEITYVTGISFGRVKILSRICDVTLEKQSVVYARATASSCTETLATILENGNTLHVMAHSHPGRGAAATQESSIDVNYLGNIQRAGADVIGIIVTRDGFVRFFTVEKPFGVWVQGNGVTQVQENVFQITFPQANRH